MKQTTYLAKVRQAFDADRERFERIKANEARIAELEAQLKKQSVTQTVGGITPPPFMKREEEEQKPMAVEIRTINEPVSPPAIPGRSVDTAALLQEFNQSVQTHTAKAVEQAMGYANRLSTELIESTKAQLASVGQPRIIGVQVNDSPVVKFDSPLSPQTAKLLGQMITNAKLGINTMLVGPTGCGKTTLCAMLAKALDLPFAHISWTEGMSETAALFARQFHDRTLEAAFSKSFRNGGVFLNDELDKANPNAAGKLNMAHANGHFYNEVLHEEIPRHPNYVAVAACNAPRGGDGVYTATNRLSADCLNRFRVLFVDYDPEYERMVCPHEGIYNALIHARAKLRELKSEEIISTRTLEMAYKLHGSGEAWEDIRASVTAFWPQETIDQTGLASFSPDAAQAKKRRKSTASSSSASDSSDAGGVF